MRSIPNPMRPLASVPPEYRRRGYRHTASWLFFGAFFAVVLTQGPFVIRRMGGTALQSLLLNVAQGVPLIFAILWVPLLQRRNPVRLTALFLGLGGAVMMLSGLARDTWTFAAILACSLAPATLYRPVLGTALEQIYPVQWRGKLMSLPNAADMLARVVVLVGVGWLLRQDLGAYRAVFPAAGLCMVGGALLFRGIRGGRGDQDAGAVPARSGLRGHARDSVRRALSNRMLLVFLIGYFFAACGGVVFSNALPLFATDVVDLDPVQWGTTIAAYLLAIMCSFWAWGIFMDRFGAPVTMVVTWTAMGMLMGAIYFARSWPAFLALVALPGLFMSGNIIAFFPIVMHFAPSSETMRGMGLHATLWGIRWVTMPLLVVLVVDARLLPIQYLFLLSLCLTGVGVAVMARVWRLDRRRGGAPEG